MTTFRSRNILLSSVDKYSFSSLTNRNRLNLTTLKIDKRKKNILKNSYNKISEYNEEVKNIKLYNKLLRDQISVLKIENINIKNFMKRIMTFNCKKLNNSDKNELKSFFEDYNQQLIFNKKKLKKIVDKDLIEYKKVEDNMNNKISKLIIAKDELERIKFLLENDIQRKNNFIQIYLKNFKNIGSVQENEKFRYLNDELFQNDIDTYYGKYLDVYRKNLLQTTQRWNKSKNKVNKCTKEIEELKNIIKNPNKKEDLNKEKLNTSKNNYINSTENDKDIFLLSFDEFEDDFESEITEEDFSLNDFNKNKNIDSINNNNKVIKFEKEPKFSKINLNDLKKNNISNKNNNRDIINKRNNAKKDLYYFPQNNYSNSIIRDKLDSPVISNRTISINNISKLNFNKIIFNKNLRYQKEEANNLALKKFEIENEYQNSGNNVINRNDMKIKDLKSDIKIFKNKIKKKKKLIKNFNIFYDDFLKKYNRYTNDEEY